MKASGLGIWAVLAAVAAARCGRPPVTSTASSGPFSSSSVPSSEIPPGSSIASSLVVSSVVPSSSAATSSAPVSSSSSAIETCGANQCFAAITAEPAIGESFCSSWLSQTPETTVITETATVTATYTSLETATTLLTLTTATTTKIIGSTTHFLKRVAAPSSVQISSAPAPSDAILGQCTSDDERVSSACSCYLSTTATVTVYETSTATVASEVASTVIETTTTNVIATVEAMATHTVPAQPILNANLEGYLRTGNILPWTDSVASLGGQMQIINGVNPCVGAGDCVGGQVVVRPYPPNGPGRYVSLKQSFLARPSSTYTFSFVYRCLNYDAFTKIEVWYAGQKVGTTANCYNSAAFFRPSTAIQFTTDATGVGEIEVRFVSSGATPYLYFYADDFKATLA